MLYRVTLLPFLLLCSMVVAAFGASESSPAFVRAVVTAPLEGEDSLRVSLEPDEPLCRKAYGEAWASRCFASPGREGAPVRGVRLSPDVPGDWRWEDGRTFFFRARKPWTAGQTFSLSMDDLSLPSRVKLSSAHVSFSTPPLAVLRLHADLWIDPDLDGERAVSFDMTFTTPPDRAVIERDAQIQVSDGELKLGRPEFIWGEDGSCLVRAGILSLGEKPAVVMLSLPGVAGEVHGNGTRWSVPQGRETARAQVTVPGTTTLFTVTRAVLEPAQDEHLAGEYRRDCGGGGQRR